jgi:hypothetical protein
MVNSTIFLALCSVPLSLLYAQKIYQLLATIGTWGIYSGKLMAARSLSLGCQMLSVDSRSPEAISISLQWYRICRLSLILMSLWIYVCLFLSSIACSNRRPFKIQSICNMLVHKSANWGSVARDSSYTLIFYPNYRILQKCLEFSSEHSFATAGESNRQVNSWKKSIRLLYNHARGIYPI